jgi:triacylglycerol lipase
VFVAEVDPYNDTSVRGPELAAFVDEVLACTCSGRVNIVAHSQGGLDARYVVSTLGYGDRIASITTVATPHRGTPIADLVLGLVPGVADPLVDALLGGVGDFLGDPTSDADLRASLLELSTEGAAAFDTANPDDPQVAAWSWAGRAGPALPGEAACEGGDVAAPTGDAPIFAPLLVTWALIAGLDGGENDGLVPVESSRWGHFRGCVSADHLAEITGLFSAFDHASFYVDVATFLSQQGL